MTMRTRAVLLTAWVAGAVYVLIILPAALAAIFALIVVLVVLWQLF